MEKTDNIWTPFYSPQAPKGYLYKMLKINKHFVDNEKTKLLKDSDFQDHNWPTIRQGKYKGYIGMGSYLMVRVKL